MPKDNRKSKRLQAVCVVRSGEMLCKAFSLSIENGVVVEMEELTRAEDMPAIAIGQAQRLLWTQYRENKESFLPKLEEEDEPVRPVKAGQKALPQSGA